MTAPLRLALVGFGMSGRSLHGRLIDAVDGLAVGAIVARSSSARSEAAAAFPDAQIVSSVAGLAALDDRPVLAVVATPDASHAEVTEEVLEAGFGTVVDKPLATTAAAARHLRDLARDRGLPIVPFQNRRWDGDFLTVRRVLESGLLGEVFHFDTSMDRWFPGSAPGWRGEAIPGGVDGALGGFGSHAVDQAVALFGPVQSVYGEVAKRRAASAVNDDVFLALRHMGGVTTHVSMALVRSDPSPRFRVQGLSGSFVKHGFDGQQPALIAGGDPRSPSWGAEPESDWGAVHLAGGTETVPTVPGAWTEFYRELALALHGAGELPVSVDDAIHVLDVLEAGRRSSETGEVVRPPS
ncbi:Gfo/Idh/MocA family oxidoreductase [Lysobacter korlensis]|uniref:Gfo/Idh/MocA family oxidoreductase n=1 Tax=Lysobacter korlensis TaxID=553636 RepID=A0ABV6S0A9_9GAMM